MTTTKMPHYFNKIRVSVIGLAAASAGLSMVFVSLSKLLLVICGAAFLIDSLRRGNDQRLQKSYTALTVMVVLAVFAVSILWTTGPIDDALGSFAKYGKLLTVILMMALIRSRKEAAFALFAFMVGQVFLVFSSWLLFFHVPVPWATSNMALNEYAVFSSYLDEGIMTAVAASIFWHLRSYVPGRYGRSVAVGISALCLLNVLFVLSGRSGHVVALTLISLAVMWELPRRYRPVVVLLPFVLGAALFMSSEKFRERLTMVKDEVNLFSQSSPSTEPTSSGVRLKLWIDSIRIIEKRPLTGSGVGSWSTEYNIYGRATDPLHVDAGSNFNPHQEYLLWGVQLGLPGILLFCALMLAVIVDASRLEKPVARAAQSAAVGLAVASFFNSSLYDALIGDFFCITFGLLLAFRWRQPDEDSLNGSSDEASGLLAVQR